jgi:hypothetical protein
VVGTTPQRTPRDGAIATCCHFDTNVPVYCGYRLTCSNCTASRDLRAQIGYGQKSFLFYGRQDHSVQISIFEILNMFWSNTITLWNGRSLITQLSIQFTSENTFQTITTKVIYFIKAFFVDCSCYRDHTVKVNICCIF